MLTISLLLKNTFHIIYFSDSQKPNSITAANVDKLKYPETFTSSDFVNKNDLELIEGKTPIWWNYFLCGVKGVVGELLHRDDKDGHSNGVDEAQNFGFIALMDGKIPPSAGLSSSSAVVVAAAVCKCSCFSCNINQASYMLKDLLSYVII